MEFTAKNWVNEGSIVEGKSPALSADNLNRLENGILESFEFTRTKINDLSPKSLGCIRIDERSYTGDGKGKDITLEFDGKPLIVFVNVNSNSTVMVWYHGSSHVSAGASTNSYVSCEWQNNSIKFEAGSNILNVDGAKYKFTAIIQ